MEMNLDKFIYLWAIKNVSYETYMILFLERTSFPKTIPTRTVSHETNQQAIKKSRRSSLAPSAAWWLLISHYDMNEKENDWFSLPYPHSYCILQTNFCQQKNLFFSIFLRKLLSACFMWNNSKNLHIYIILLLFYLTIV